MNQAAVRPNHPPAGGGGGNRRPQLAQLALSSPYSVHYKAQLSGEERTLIAQRTRIAKWPRADLEDRYLRMLDEHYALKKENLANHDKIRRLVTRIMRLTGQSFDRGAGATPTPAAGRRPPSRLLDGAVGDDGPMTVDSLQLRIIDLESHNAQLRERFQVLLDQQQRGQMLQSHRARCVSASSGRIAPGSGRSSSALKNKRNLLFKSQESMLSASAEEAGSLDRRDSASDIVSEQEITELKVIIEQLQKDLKVQGDEPVAKYQDCLHQLQVTQNELSALICAKTEIEEKLSRELDAKDEQFEMHLNGCRSEINDLNERLQNEVAANQALVAAKEDIEQHLRAAQQANQDTEDIQSENTALKKHRENIANLAKDLAGRTSDLREMRKQNISLRTELDDLRNHVQQQVLGQDEGVQKMRTLQDSHDALAVQLEGVRAQCAYLEQFSRTLETENRRLQDEVFV